MNRHFLICQNEQVKKKIRQIIRNKKSTIYCLCTSAYYFCPINYHLCTSICYFYPIIDYFCPLLISYFYAHFYHFSHLLFHYSYLLVFFELDTIIILK